MEIIIALAAWLLLGWGGVTAVLRYVDMDADPVDLFAILFGPVTFFVLFMLWLGDRRAGEGWLNKIFLR